MFERTYRQRLEADLARWETDGVITPAVVAGIRTALPPLSPSVSIPVVMGIVGGLLIAAAFLAFVAAHWLEVARLWRFAILAAGIVLAHGLAAAFASAGRTVLADLCASVGAIIFGAAIALVGQMYHLGDDFAGGMLLWAMGALTSAALTGSRGALAVALVAGTIWTATRISELRDPHLPFVVFWFVAGSLALIWKSRVAYHLIAVASLPWWIFAAFQLDHNNLDPFFVFADGAALLFGGGLALAAAPWERTRDGGAVLATYGAFSLAIVAAFVVATFNDPIHAHSAASHPLWANACGMAGVVLAFAAAASTRRIGTAFAGSAIGLVLLAAPLTPPAAGEPWAAYAVELCAMLCLVVSGMLDGVRSRIVAGWIGIAGVIAGITWAVKGSLLHRSAFLAVAGVIATGLATVLNRLLPRTDA